MSEEIDAQTRQLAAMAYGESSSKDDADEMSAIASVLVRQRDARGYRDIGSFVQQERSYSYVVGDGNARYARLMKASAPDIEKDPGMKTALAAARNALAGGPDKSNGAYFWDGADIKTNYAHHAKVKVGIKFTDPAHNLYKIDESTIAGVVYKIIATRNRKTKVVTKKKVEAGRFDHTYESTAAYGGTIFWRFNPDYVKLNHAKEYK